MQEKKQENKTKIGQTMAQKVKAALHVYVKSLTSVKYYKEIIKTDLKFSLKYYVVLAVLFTLVNSLFSTVQVLPKIQKGINDAIEYALDLYEDDLVITIRDGELSVNKEEPYIIPFVGAMENSSNKAAENLIVFDSVAGLDDIKDTYDTLILVNGTNILVQSSSKIKVIPIKEFPDTTFTKADFVAAINQVRSLTKFVPYIAGIVLVVAMLVYYLGFRLLYLVFVAATLWMIGAVRKMGLPYSKYYKIALHTMSLPLTVGLVNSVISANIYLSNWFFLLNLIFGALVVMSLDGRVTSGEGGGENVSESGSASASGDGNGEESDSRGANASGDSA